MPERRVAHFRQVDLTRAIRGATAGGMAVGRISIDREGRIEILAAQEATEPLTAFDEWKARRNARPS